MANEELIPISKTTVGGIKVSAVDGRKLHEALGVGKNFPAWITERIETYDFKEHTDFETYCNPGLDGSMIGASKEYILSLNMAKELAMVQRSPQGKQVREYFIECESRLNKPMSMLEMVLVQAQAMVDQERKNALVQAQVQTIATRVDAIESIHKHVEEELSRLPEPSAEAPELTPYDATRMVVADYCDRNKLTDGREFARCYTQIYEHLNARYGVRLGACRKVTPKESLLQVADRLGHIDKVYTLAVELFAPQDRVVFRIKELN